MVAEDVLDVLDVAEAVTVTVAGEEDDDGLVLWLTALDPTTPPTTPAMTANNKTRPSQKIQGLTPRIFLR